MLLLELGYNYTVILRRLLGINTNKRSSNSNNNPTNRSNTNTFPNKRLNTKDQTKAPHNSSIHPNLNTPPISTLAPPPTPRINPTAQRTPPYPPPSASCPSTTQPSLPKCPAATPFSPQVLSLYPSPSLPPPPPTPLPHPSPPDSHPVAKRTTSWACPSASVLPLQAY